MVNGLKCPQCSTIQFKGKYCRNDGMNLVDCDTDIENQFDFGDTQVESNQVQNQLSKTDYEKIASISTFSFQKYDNYFSSFFSPSIFKNFIKLFSISNIYFLIKEKEKAN